MDLNEIAVFARVVQAGSITAAARALAMPKSTVSRKVYDLEERLGARLLQRTTRKLSLTDAGRIYYEYAERIVSEIDEAEHAVTRLEQAPRGLLRVTLPVNLGVLGPIIAAFAARYPDVQLELVCTDRVVDLVEERFDVAVRIGHLVDSTLVARSLGTSRQVLVASRAYIAKRGRPRTPEELQRHDGLLFGAGAARFRFLLQSGERSVEVAVSTTRIVVNDMEMLQAAAVAGLGIALLPTYRCIDDLRAKRLERVLPGWNAPTTPIHAVYPSTRHLSPKVKSFVDHLQAHMTPPPWELGPAP